MKKIFTVILLILLSVLLFACSGKNETFTVEPFEATVEVESGGKIMTGKLSYASPYAISLTVLEPETIKNLTFAVQDGSDYMVIGSMKSACVPNSAFPTEKNVFENLFKAMETLQNGLTAKKGGTAKINSNSECGKCMITFNTDTCRIECIDAGRFKYKFIYE
ncbi:MAG: hypothetical protein ACI4XE_05515 [Acutalibacteraceae bacterium]